MITVSPIVVSTDHLGLGPIASMAVSPDAQRVYFGLMASNPGANVAEALSTGERLPLGLGVLRLRTDGRPEDEPRRYVSSPEPLSFGTGTTVCTMLASFGRGKIYLGGTQIPQNPFPRMDLSVCDLDANGDPTGACRNYSPGDLGSVDALALHPTLPLLYLCGRADGAVYVYPLDATGEPQGAPVRYDVSGLPKTRAAVSPDGKRLYLGASSDTLEIVDLDANGMPAGPPRSFTAGSELLPDPYSNNQDPASGYFDFCYTPRALYRRYPTRWPTFAELPVPKEPVQVWPLDAQGHPIGTPKPVAAITQRALNADPANGLLWVAEEHTFPDAFTGASTSDGTTPTAYPLDANGSPQTAEPVRYSTSYFQYGRRLEIADNGRPILLTEPQPAGDIADTNEVSDYRLRMTVLDTTPSQSPFTMYLSLNNAMHLDHQLLAIGQQQVAAGLRVNQPSPLASLDSVFLDPTTKQPVAILKDQNGQIPVLVAGITYDDGSTVQTLALRIEVFQGDPAAGGMLLKSMTDHVDGSKVLFLLPGYGPLAPGTRLDQIELMSEHAKRYLHAARAVALTERERPRQFVVSCTQLFGDQGHVGQLHTQAETVALLGFNTVFIEPNWTGIPPTEINTILDSWGLHRRVLATGDAKPPGGLLAPDGMFEFNLKQLQPDVDRWAHQLVASLASTSGAAPEQLVDFKLFDEPSWSYPTLLDEVRTKGAALQDFREFLQLQDLQPADLGAASWDAVFPAGASAATASEAPLTARRLFYWTMRYFPTSASLGQARLRTALETAFAHSFTADVNWTPALGLNAWYTPGGPNTDAATGGFDWFISGRLHAHTLWTEDWFPDQNAQQWSVQADLLRCAGHDTQPFSGYIVGNELGSHPAGASYKVFSLVGHGAKIVDVYCFGPGRLFLGNGWSDNFAAYRPIANALRLLARAEHLLFPGQPSHGNVAVLVPDAGALWDDTSDPRLYTTEMQKLHFALIHAGYTVDFVDDHDIAAGSLTSSPYTTLYVTGPNVSAKAQAQVAQWVSAGHAIVATPGAGVADEYNTRTTTIDEVLGLTERQACRDPDDGAPTAAQAPVAAYPLQIVDQRLAATATAVPLVAPVIELRPSSPAPTSAATFGGKPVITINRHGRGSAIAYGFFPGRQYWVTPNRDDPDGLPYGWGKAQRDIAVAAARIANTPRPVALSHELVEARKLASENGIAIVLLNWSNRTIGELTVSVAGAAHLQKVRSAHGEPVTMRRTGTTLTVQLPLTYVDVLMLE